MGDDQGRSVELAPPASPRSRFALVSPAVDHERAPENVEQAGSDGHSSSPRLRHSASARASRKLLAAPSSWKDGLVSLGREAGRQAARNKCSFCLGLGTCLLTVITAATMQSLLAASPAVFLRGSENSKGQIDLEMSLKGMMNYTAVRANVQASARSAAADGSYLMSADEVTYLSPRNEYGLTRIFDDPQWTDQTVPRPVRYYLPAMLTALDTDADLRAGVGREWALPAVGPNECYANTAFASVLEVGAGDNIDALIRADVHLGAYLVRHSEDNDLTDFFTLVRGNATAGTAAKCIEPSDKRRRADDPILQGARAVKCDADGVHFCGTVRDNTACGMDNVLLVRLRIKDVVPGWKYRIGSGLDQSPDEGDGDEDFGGGGGGGGGSADKVPRVVIELPHVMKTLISALPVPLREETSPGYVTRNLTVVPPMKSVIAERRASLMNGGTSGSSASTSATEADALTALSYDQVGSIVGNLPPRFRSSVLLQAQYNDVQAMVVLFSGRVVSAVGAIWIDVSNPVMEGLRANRFTGLYLGMVMDILIAILLGLSSVLIYSLMMINVQSRQFELAVRRMLGATKTQIIALLVAQAMSFAVPSVVVGLPVAHFVTKELFVEFTKISGVNVDTSGQALSGTGVAYGLFLGLFIPIIGAIGPIRAALGMELREALDVTRSKTKVIEYKIESETDRAKISPAILAVGGSLSVFGFLIYYLLPLALLSVNLRVFFAVFVALLLSLIVGLVLLASNCQVMTEKLVAGIFLGAWAKNVLRRLALKNLIAHRRRNWKTSIMYSLSLAFIIFIAVASQLEFQTLRYERLREAGSEIVVLAGDKNTNTGGFVDQPYFTPKQFRKLRARLLATNSSFPDLGVESIAWMSGGGAVETSNVGTTNNIGITRVICVSPYFFDVADPTFYNAGPMWMRPMDGAVPSLRLAEQLYTARGSQGAVAPTAFLNTLDYPEFKQGTPVAPISFLRADRSTLPFPTETTVLLKPIAYLNSAPAIRMSPYFGRSRFKDVIVAPATFLSLFDEKFKSMEDLPISRILVRMKNGVSPTQAQFKAIKAALDSLSETQSIPLGVWGLADELESFLQLLTIIDFFFVSITLVGLMLCFFSLVASMVSNIAEQAQDIAIVRSMGLSKKDVVKVYVYEAFILVVASAVLGCGTGWSIAWTFSSQRSLFTQLPLAFYFPWPIVVTVIGSAVICAMLAAGIPSYNLVQKRITQLLRLFGS